MRTVAVASLVAALVLAGCTAQTPSPGKEPILRPTLMVALGDSITRGANLDGAAPGDHPEGSWATGNASALAGASHAERLRAQGELERGARNLAVSGARVTDFERQAREALPLRPEYVTVLFGANDACARNVDRMTKPDDFRAAFRAGAETLREGLPEGAIVFVASVPDVTRLAEVHEGNPRAEAAWRFFRVCPVLLSANATDETRAIVRERVVQYNDILREEAERYGFRHDGGAVAAAQFEVVHVSDLDYFHPSLAGQAELANATWARTPFG